MPGFLPFVCPSGLHFWAILLKKTSITRGGNGHIGKRIKIVLETIYRFPPLIRSPYLSRNCGHIREVVFGENWVPEVNSFIVAADDLSWEWPLREGLMYKEVFLKYQANARFPSLCLPSGNGFLRYFYSRKKNSHNSGDNHDNGHIGKKCKLFLETI